MQLNTTTPSHHKIVVLLVFLCVSIMTSFFIFHLSQKRAAPTLADEVHTFFPIPRDINPFELVSAGNKPFTQQNFLHHWTLLFFGFTHCENVCPATLQMMHRAYQELHPLYPDLQVVLVSLDSIRDTPRSLAAYTHSFNPDFIGVTGKIEVLRKLQSQLGIFSARDEKSGSNYQLQHTASILLINPQGKWAGIFKYGMTPTQFANAFKEGVASIA